MLDGRVANVMILPRLGNIVDPKLLVLEPISNQAIVEKLLKANSSAFQNVIYQYAMSHRRQLHCRG